MSQIPSALLEPPAPAPAASETGSHPPSPPDTPFATVLDDHQARTAVAEGHRRAEREPADPAPADRPADASALAALLGGVPLPVDAVVAVVATVPATQGDAPAGPAPIRPAAVPALPTTAVATGTGVPADATALPLRPPVPGAQSAVASLPSLPIGPDAAGADGREIASATPLAAARATKLADVLQAATRPAAAAATPAPEAPPRTPPAATVAGAARTLDATPSQGAANAATTPAPAAPTAAPAASASAAPSAPPTPARAVGLEHAVETVRLALRAGAERGVSHARISLTPRALGTIEIHLRQTSDGLVARVVAEHGAAVQQLQQAGGELRRQLEQSGINLLRLDIGASGEDAGRAADRRAFAGAFGDDDRGGSRDRGAAGDDPLAPLDGAVDPTTSTTTLTLPNGALIDVLA